ncbi:MAG: Fic family protein [Chloroflexota bacterium]|nr:Fic family protein [Chloroflexota bacterium]
MTTHPFIKFPPNLGEFPAHIWLLLGEIQARIDHIKNLPIPRDESNLLRLMYLTKGVHSTTAIEGNSFSEEEVERIIAGKLQAPPSRKYQQQQIDNMVEAFNMVGKTQLGGSSGPFTLALLNSYHEIILNNLDDSLADDVVIGAPRTHRVMVGRYLAAPPEECPQLVDRYCDWLNQEMPAPAGYEIAGQIIKAVVAHVYFAWIHPYGDGNGRMTRLIEFVILLRAGVPDVAAHLLSNFYNKTRDQYYSNLQASHGEYRDGSYTEKSNLLSFIGYALQGFKDELDEQFSIIHGMQVRIIWHDYIHAEFRKRFSENLSPARQRQKRLILDLTVHKFDEAVTKNEIRGITPALYLAYAERNKRMIQRDLNALVDMELLTHDGAGYKPNTDILMGFFANARVEED